MTEPTAPGFCCGEIKKWNEGQPPIACCQVCPKSPIWWRKESGAAARLADRGLREPVLP